MSDISTAFGPAEEEELNIENVFGGQSGADEALPPIPEDVESITGEAPETDAAGQPDAKEPIPAAVGTGDTSSDSEKREQSMKAETPSEPEAPKPAQKSGRKKNTRGKADRKPADTPAAVERDSTSEPPQEDLFSVFSNGSADAPLPTAGDDKPGGEPQSLFDKPPVFSYGGAKEKIEDASQTFEELRIVKADDFPELEEGKSVSWKVKYGPVTKPVVDPKGTTIAKMKQDIEKSKSFLDGLQKAKEKDKNSDCLVIPSVVAKSKGIASYKGVYASVADALASDKVICLIPARNGKTYELRKTEMGRFIAPKRHIAEVADVRAGFVPALPRIPREIMGQIISFFRCFMNESGEYEALVLLYWDRQEEEFVPYIPRQRTTKVRIDADLRDSVFPEERYLLYADIHSHNSMAAKFSPTDDEDEKATRLYIVLGSLDRFYPSISARVSCGGTYLEINPELVMEGIGEEFPTDWLDRVERVRTSVPPDNSALRRLIDEISGMEGQT